MSLKIKMNSILAIQGFKCHSGDIHEATLNPKWVEKRLAEERAKETPKYIITDTHVHVYIYEREAELVDGSVDDEIELVLESEEEK